MKLGNFFVGNVFTISQSPHGSSQGGKAIDCVPTSGTRVIAPCDMDIYYRANTLGHQSYSYARGEGFSRLVLVHCIIEKAGFVKRGTDIGYLASGGAVHLHTAIEVNGAWDTVLNYMDRSIQLALTTGFTSQHWKSWATWKDLQLNPVTNPNWTIPRSAYDTGKAQFQPFVERRRPDLIKGGVDTMEWLILHGTKELPAELESYYAKVDGLEKVIGSQNEVIGDLNKRIEDQELTHQDYVKELNLRYSTQQQNLITCEENLEPTKKEDEELKGKVETLNTELDKMINAYAKLVKDNKKSEVNWGSYISRLIRAIRSFIAKNARDNS